MAAKRSKYSKTTSTRRTTRSTKASDVIELLKEDHRRVEKLFDQFEKKRDGQAKEQHLRDICRELSIHATVEEELLYPGCRGEIDDQPLDEAYVEHDGAKGLIAELLTAGTDDFRDAKVKVLSELIKHHVREEEKRDGILAQAKRSELDLDDLGERVRQRKQELERQFEEQTPLPTTRSLVGEAPERGEILEFGEVSASPRESRSARTRENRFGDGRSGRQGREREQTDRGEWFGSDPRSVRDAANGGDRWNGGREQDHSGRDFFRSDAGERRWRRD